MTIPPIATAISFRNLNWDHLRVFIAVVRTGSASAAVSGLSMDLSTITRQLKQLEAEMGTHLFERGRHGHRPTAAAKRLAEHVEKIEDSILQMEVELAGDSDAVAGEVRLGTTEGFGATFIAPHVAKFCGAHPGLAVELLALPRYIFLSKREADLAIFIERPESASYVCTRLTDYRLMLYASREWLDNHPPLRSAADLVGHPFIGYINNLTYSDHLRYLDAVAKNADVRLRSTSIIAQFNAVRAGHGLAILPCFLAQTAPELVPVLPEISTLTRTFWLYAERPRYELARVKRLWDYLRDVAAANQGFLLGEDRVMRYVP